MAAAGALALTLTACFASVPGRSPSTSTSSAAPVVSTPSTATAPSLPAPGRTVEATVPNGAVDLRGARIAVVFPDDSETSRVLGEALRGFVTANGLVLDEFVADGDATSIDAAFARALATAPDVVAGVGASAVDVFAYNSPQWLDQDFLLLGAQVAEPTANVTAVIWDGATSRGSGAPADGELDDTAVTVERATAAVAVGLSTVLSGESGVVLRLPG